MAEEQEHGSVRRRVWRKRTRENREGVAAAMGDVLSGLVERLGGTARIRLTSLWRVWAEVQTPEIAALAPPLGARGRTLVLGAEDPVVMQELAFMAPELLRRANGFLKEEYFDKVVFELVSGRVPLDGIRGLSAPPPAPRVKGPRDLGGLADLMASDDPVGRSYRAYVRRFRGESDTGGQQ